MVKSQLLGIEIVPHRTTALRKCGYEPTFKCLECRAITEQPDRVRKEDLVCRKCGSGILKKCDRVSIIFARPE